MYTKLKPPYHSTVSDFRHLHSLMLCRSGEFLDLANRIVYKSFRQPNVHENLATHINTYLSPVLKDRVASAADPVALMRVARNFQKYDVVSRVLSKRYSPLARAWRRFIRALNEDIRLGLQEATYAPSERGIFSPA